MRLMYVVDALAVYGGLERIVVDKINWLSVQGGCEVHVVTSDQGNHPVSFPLNPGVFHDDLDIRFFDQYKYSGIRRFLCIHRLHQLYRSRLKVKIRDVSPDVVICSQKQLMHDVYKVCDNIPLVFECHSACLSAKFENFRFWQKLLNTKYNRDAGKADVVVALTNGDASEWRKFAQRVEVIPNMVHLNDTGRYSSCQSKKAIFVGRYSTQKDIGSLIRIWQLVYQRHPEWELHVYGGYGNQPDKWLEIITQTNANIFAHEATSQINEKYLESSMLLLTSVHEPFGLVLSEAMSCGLPVVSFDCPYGPADIISDGVDGFLIKDRNIVVFADRVCQLIENEEIRVRMGKAGILSSQRYRADRIMPQWFELFKQVVHSKDCRL